MSAEHLLASHQERALEIRLGLCIIALRRLDFNFTGNAVVSNSNKVAFVAHLAHAEQIP
jgi:hypothetical protein